MVDSGRQEDRVTLVVAQDAPTYYLWLRANRMSQRKAQYISGPEQLYGHKRVKVEIVSYPVWWTADDDRQLADIVARSND
jgi:hypothetical protein